jgi:WD40 repeat protein
MAAQMPPPHLWAVVFSSDGQSIVTASAQSAPAYMPRHGELIFWSVTTGKKKRIVREDWGIRGLACAPNGKFIVIGNSIGQTKLVNPITGKTIATLTPHSGLVSSVAISDNNQLIASGSFDGSIFLWDALGAERGTLIFPAGKVNNIAISPDSHALVATSRTGKAYLFDLSQLGEPRVMDALPTASEDDANVDVLAFEPDGRKFVTGCQTSLRVWDTSTCQLVRELNGCTSSVTGAAFSPDGQVLAITDSDGKLSLWNAETGERFKTVSAHAGSIFGIAFSPDGRRLATVGVSDYTLKIWDAQTLAPIASNTR